MRPRPLPRRCDGRGKLLHLVRPDVLYLGQKDAQQTWVLRKMVADLEFPVAVDIVPTMRESDGLAMSSRNAYLSDEQRAEAASLYRALLTLREALERGASKARAVGAARATLSALATSRITSTSSTPRRSNPLEGLAAPAYSSSVRRASAARG